MGGDLCTAKEMEEMRNKIKSVYTNAVRVCTEMHIKRFRFYCVAVSFFVVAACTLVHACANRFTLQCVRARC